jgi:phosphoglycolate phosphatase
MLVYRLIIFDFDGTLADSRDSVVDCMAKTFEHFGDPVPDPERIVVNIGKRLEEVVADLSPGLDAKQVEERAAYYRRLYKTEGVPGIRAIDGAEKLLEKLTKAGVRLALASNRKDDVLQDCVKQLGWRDYFGFVGGVLADGVSKPDPAFRIRDMREAFSDIDASEILVVGDAEDDVLYAKKLGVDSCLALYGYGRNAKARIEMPDFEVEIPEDIEPLVF